VELLSGPAALARGFRAGTSSEEPSSPFRRSIKKREAFLDAESGRASFGVGWNHADLAAGRDPLDFISGFDSIPIRDVFRDGDLAFAGDFAHVLTIVRIGALLKFWLGLIRRWPHRPMPRLISDPRNSLRRRHIA
jgi:hypothetical protein